MSKKTSRHQKKRQKTVEKYSESSDKEILSPEIRNPVFIETTLSENEVSDNFEEEVSSSSLQENSDDDHHISDNNNNEDFFNKYHDDDDGAEYGPVDNQNQNLEASLETISYQPQTSSNAGQIILNENVEREESLGLQSSFVPSPGYQPKSLKRIQRSKKVRRQNNGFVKPDESFISAFDDGLDDETIQSRCKICYHALNGYLGESVEELYKMKTDPMYRRKKTNHDQNCEKGHIFLSSFKMKHDELLSSAANEAEVCASLAKIWNYHIDIQKEKYLEGITVTEETNHVNDFFNSLENDLKKIDLKKNKNTIVIDELKNNSILSEDDIDWGFLPPYIDVDEVMHHFKKCQKTDMSGILRETVYELRSIARYQAKNCLFKKSVSTALDSDEEITSNVGIINDKSVYCYLSTIKMLKEIASEYRSTVKDEKGSIVFNNLGLLRPLLPNIDRMKTVGLIKHNQLILRQNESKNNSIKFQYKKGDTDGI